MPPDRTSQDDSLMERFDEQRLRRFTARDAVVAPGLIALLLLVFSGGSVRDAGEEMNPGLGRDLVLAVGRPAGWVADQLPFASIGHTLTGWLSPDTKLVGTGFATTATTMRPGGAASAATTMRPGGAASAAVTPDWLEASALGEPQPKHRLHTLMVTGDSLSTPLDLELGRRLAPDGVDVVRDPHLATGICRDDLVDWAQLSATQVADHHPDAVVIFIGANEGLPMPGPDGRTSAAAAPKGRRSGPTAPAG